jgi:hypothetical protein
MRVVDPACAGDSHNRWLNFWGARQSLGSIQSGDDFPYTLINILGI